MPRTVEGMSETPDTTTARTPGLAGHPPAWTDDAACRGLDPSRFFWEREGVRKTTSVYRDWVEDAAAICAICPVRHQCLAWALTQGEDEGIWGGTTPEARISLVARLTTPAETLL